MTYLQDEATLRNPLVSISLVTSSLLTLFLFYIDEGYYSFAWMSEPGAWIVFSVYVFIFFLLQVFLFGFLFNTISNLFKGKFVIPSLSLISLMGLIVAGSIIYMIFKIFS